MEPPGLQVRNVQRNTLALARGNESCCVGRVDGESRAGSGEGAGREALLSYVLFAPFISPLFFSFLKQTGSRAI